MSRRQTGGWLVDEWDVLDPDIVARSLAILNFHTESYADSLWHLFLQWQPEDLLRAREVQIMALARYARQSLLQWDDVDVREIRRWFDHLRDLMAQESAAMQMNDG